MTKEICMYCGNDRPTERHKSCCGEMHFQEVPDEKILEGNWTVVQRYDGEVVIEDGPYGFVATVHAACNTDENLMVAHLIASSPALYKLAQDIYYLNPDNPEIGAGKLKQLVANAKEIINRIEQ